VPTDQLGSEGLWSFVLLYNQLRSEGLLYNQMSFGFAIDAMELPGQTQW
jgi:hypothetical protein